MFEFLLFIVTCAVITFLVAHIQKHINQPNTKLQPVKIECEHKQHQAPRHKGPY